MQNLRMLTALAALVMTATTLTACGGNECASGTTEKDGQCVPTSTLTCGDGTMLAEGACVPTNTTTCGDGTMLADGKCVPTSTTECGDGTMLVGGECVPTSTLTCGAGTTEMNGACVPTSTLACGAGTVESNGNCVVAMAACGTGTQLDANSGTCVVTDMVCGAGTAFTNGSCLPTAAVCATGTTFNAMTGTCLPDATCQVGDVVLSGVCVRPVQQLLAGATVTEAENNDPTLGGTAQGLTIPAAGTQLVVAGGIDAPTDLDADMEIDQDLDGFTVTLAAGDLIQVAVQPVAGPSLGFLVFGPDGTNYTRASSLGLTQGAARQIFAPVAGEYTIVVAPAAALSGNIGPIGNADWKYALTLEQLAAPTATDIDASAMAISGQFANLSDNLFRATNLTGGLTQLTVGDIGAHVEGVYYIGSSLTTMTRVFPATAGSAQTLSLPAGENLVFFDWTEATGPDTAFELNAGVPSNLQDLGALSDMSKLSTPVTLPIGQSYYYTFTATPGNVLRLGQSNDEASGITVNVTEANGDAVVPFGAAFAAANNSKVTLPRSLSHSSALTPVYLYTRIDEATTYLVTVTNTSTTTPRTNVIVNAQLNAVTDLGTKAVGEAIAITGPALTLNNRVTYKVTFTEDVRLSATLSSPSGDPDLYVYKTDGALLCSGNSSVTNCTATAGDYYIEVDGYSAVPSFTVNATTTQAPIAEIEPNNDAATATPIPQGREGSGSFGNADSDFFAITVPSAIPAGSALRVNLVPTATTGASITYTCTLRSGGAVVATSTSINDCVLFGGALAAGTYTLEVTNSSATASNYTFNTSVVTPFNGVEVEPNNDAATANLITLPSTVYGESAPGASTDTDFYSFTLANALTAQQLLTARIANTTGRSNTTSFTLELRNAAGTVVTTSTSGSFSTGGLAAGNYTLAVRRTTSSTTTTGRYSLAAEIFTVPAPEFTASPALAIPDNNATGISNVLSVSKPACVIASTFAGVNITHTYKGDVTVTLVAPDGTSVILHNKTGAGTDNIVETYPVTAAASGNLASLNGKMASGDWTLRVSDTGSGDVGTLNSWSLAFTCAP